MLSWRRKYFQSGVDREPPRVKIPELPDVFVISIENDNTGRIVSRCREAPNAIKFPSRKKIVREVQSALIRAAAVHAPKFCWITMMKSTPTLRMFEDIVLRESRSTPRKLLRLWGTAG